MLHLFERVYVLPDFLQTGRERDFVISNMMDDNRTNTFKSIKQLWVQHNLSSWEEFFNYLVISDDIILYTDVDNMTIMFCALMKTIFPLISDDMLYKVYNTYAQRIMLYFPTEIATHRFGINRGDWDNTGPYNRKQLLELNNTLVVWDDEGKRKQWVNNHIEAFSLEFHIATYFNDRTHLKRFKEKYVSFVIKACYNEVYEWYEFFSTHFMLPAVKSILNHHIDWDTENWRGELQKCPNIAWMFDDNFDYVSRNYIYFQAHLVEAYEVGKMILQFINAGDVNHSRQAKRSNIITLMDRDYYESDHAQYVYSSLEKLLANLGTLTDEQVEDYIEQDIKSDTASALFDLLSTNHKHNPWLIHLIYEMRHNNDHNLAQLEIQT